MTDLYFNGNFVKLDLVLYQISDRYIQRSGECILNLDKISSIERLDDVMYLVSTGTNCFYITEEQYKQLCDKL